MAGIESANLALPSAAPVPPPGLFQLSSKAPLSDVELRRLSPAALAYLGDAVYELYSRCRYLWPPGSLSDCHQRTVASVNAIAQARSLKQLEPLLTRQEQDILRRGRNAAPRRKAAGDAKTYQQATGFETLIGFLYLSNPQRLQHLLSHLSLPSSL